jgi:N-[(2S)-2-amino-2-carboxyethyl]-L-glutamate dehydrogenase
MLIINEEDILNNGLNWNETIDVIEEAVINMSNGDFSQPVKPYLRFRNLKNRIIAMPAFIGGEINTAGIKWIASFPGNIALNKPRAHSVVILNDTATGEPVGIITSTLLSVIRTASVTGLVIRQFEKVRELQDLKIGIIGFGPIGQYHLKMCLDLLGDKINKVMLYDLREISPGLISGYDKVEIVNSWQEAYADADIFITCTVSDKPYIDLKPKPGSLHANVSLRDYKTIVYEWFKDAIIVDNWDEICREKTDIEMMHIEKGLQENATKSIIDMVADNCLENYDKESPVMFNPMGMAVFDVALGAYYCKACKVKQHDTEAVLS